MTGTDTLDIFEATAGISAVDLSLLIRTIACGLFLIWAAWIVYGQIQSMQNQSLDFHDVSVAILRVLLLCSLMIVVVFSK